jgi:hypothetical protein
MVTTFAWRLVKSASIQKVLDGTNVPVPNIQIRSAIGKKISRQRHNIPTINNLPAAQAILAAFSYNGKSMPSSIH